VTALNGENAIVAQLREMVADMRAHIEATTKAVASICISPEQLKAIEDHIDKAIAQSHVETTRIVKQVGANIEKASRSCV
jgi:hypothetical protein